MVPRGADTRAAVASGDQLPLQLSLLLTPPVRSNTPPRKRAAAAARPEPSLRLTLSQNLDSSRATPGSVTAVVGTPAAGGQGTARVGRDPQSRGTTTDDGPDAPEQPIPFDPRPAATPRRPVAGSAVPAGAQNAPGDSLPDIGETRWGMAPIRWAGNTVSSLNSTQGQGTNFLNDINTVALQASSFVVAPYVAQWNGSFNYNLGKSTYSSSAGQNVKGVSSGLSYSLGADVLPLSRYPLSVNFTQGSSETRAFDVGQETRFNNISVRQQYRPEEGRERYGASFNRNSFSTATGTSSTTSLLGDFSTGAEFDFDHLLEGRHALNANFGLTSSAADLSAENYRRLTGKVSHGWWVHEDLSINSALEYTRNQTTSAQGNVPIENAANLLLGTTSFTWRPYEDQPLTLTGGGNLIHTQVTSNGAKSSLLNVVGNVTGTYRFNNNLSASGGASAGILGTSEGPRAFINSQSAAVSYTGDPMQLMGFNYGWGVGGGASRTASSVGQNFVGTSVSANHSLGRNFIFGESQAVNFSANQGLSRSTSEQGPTVTMSNSAAASWSSTLSAALRGNLSVTFSDSISNASTGNHHFQSANLTGGGAYQFTRHASLTANAGLNWSRSIASVSRVETINGVSFDNSAPTTMGTFTIGYTHRNLFSFPLLNYTGNLMYVNSFSNQRLEGSLAEALNSQQSVSMQHLLDYRLGKLAFSLRLTTIDQAGRKSASIFGSVSRDFDGIFNGRW